MSEQATETRERVGCPVCNGSGEDHAFSSENDPDPVTCFTCQGTGEVFSYGGIVLNSGGVAVEMTAVGFREMPDDDAERLVENLSSGDVSPSAFRSLVSEALRKATS